MDPTILMIRIRVMSTISLVTLLMRLHQLNPTMLIILTKALAMSIIMLTMIIMANITVVTVATLVTAMAIRATLVIEDTVVVVTTVAKAVTAMAIEDTETTDIFMSMEKSDTAMVLEVTTGTTDALSITPIPQLVI